MKRAINIRDIPEPIWYEAKALKVKLHAETWTEFLEKILQIVEESMK